MPSARQSVGNGGGNSAQNEVLKFKKENQIRKVFDVVKALQLYYLTKHLVQLAYKQFSDASPQTNEYKVYS